MTLPKLLPVPPPPQPQPASPKMGPQPLIQQGVPAFSVFRNAAFVLVVGLNIIAADTVEFIRGAALNASGSIVLNATGWWHIDARGSVGVNSSPQRFFVTTIKNGNEYRRGFDMTARGPFAGDLWGGSASITSVFNQGDTVNLGMFNGGGNNMNIESGALVCHLSGFFVGVTASSAG